MILHRIGPHATRGRRWLAIIAAALSVLTSPGIDASLLRRAAPAAVAPDRSATVTLITGDRVRFHTRANGASTAIVIPAPGREHLSFVQLATSSRSAGEHEIIVIPSDAAPLLAAGLLDEALFNVTALARDDVAGPDTAGPPLIVTFDATRARAATADVSAAGVERTHALPSINGVAVAPAAGSAGAFWQWLTGGGGPDRAADLAAGRATSPATRAGVAKVWLDGRAHLLLDESGPRIGLPRARAAGLTGQGVTVAILDGGIKADHPDLAGRITESRDFTNTRPDASDMFGHGTHVAGIVAGSGAASGGRYEGVAPQALLINGKVCILNNCSFSAIIAGMEWAAPRARIVNMSLGGDPSDGSDPLSLALDALAVQHGTLFVVAAGNTGRTQSIGNPASAREAFAVGNTTKQDVVSPRSSRGPGLGSFAIKPDLAAPGTDIVAARAPGTIAGDDDPVDGNYTRLSGTSMAAPHVAGAAALLLEAHPEWSAAQLRDALTSTATPLANATVYEQGAGRLDVGRAATQAVIASGNLSFNLNLWPHEQPASSRTVTYTNHGDAPVTLQLALNVADEAGTPAPSGAFSVDPATLVVPARGAAEASVTYDPIDRTTSLFGGQLIATDGTTSLVTPVGAYQEPERYNLTIRAIGRAASFSVLAFATNERAGEIPGDRPQLVRLNTANDTVTLRLPRGRYEVDGIILSTGLPGDPERFSSTLASRPGIALDADTTIVLDATRGRRVTARVDGVEATSVSDVLALTAHVGGDRYVNAFAEGSSTTALYAIPTAPVRDRLYVLTYEPQLGIPDATSYSTLYNLTFVTSGRIPDHLAFRTSLRDLALLRTDYHAQGVPDLMFRADFGFPRDLPLGLGRQALRSTLPARRVEYFTAHPDIAWSHFGDTSIDLGNSRLFTYRPRDVRSVAWNRAPLGPGFVQRPVFGSGRREDAIIVRVPLFNENQEGHAFNATFLPPGVTGSTTLSRGGTAVGITDFPCAGTFPVPAQPARYTLTCSGMRDLTLSNLGTRAEATFTFMDPGPAAGEQSLPLLAVRATGAVFAFNSAPAGRIFPLLLNVDRPANAVRAPIETLRLEASYDDGVTWTRVVVARLPGSDRAVAILRHPAGPGFVSLRAYAADARGNSVAQTMIRAYSLVVAP